MGIDLDYGAVLPHNEIGTDPGAIAPTSQGVEELGMTHLLAYDHVLGADRNRPARLQRRRTTRTSPSTSR